MLSVPRSVCVEGRSVCVEGWSVCVEGRHSFSCCTDRGIRSFKCHFMMCIHVNGGSASV
ncbi:hypothetical protein ACRRTK_018468 [Alexandromys fortis]